MNKNILQAMRWHQWIKNSLLFAPIVFSGKLTDSLCFFNSVIAFISFSLLVSSMYMLNDFFDLKQDKIHPVKKNRPIALGLITSKEIFLSSAVLLSISFFLSLFLGWKYVIILLIYIAMNFLYTFYIKNVVILDVLFLALFFIIRVVAGAVAVDLLPSFWLLICTFMLAVFMGFAKRRHELIVLESEAKKHRKVLEYYDSYLLDQMIAVVTTSTLMSFILYTVSSEAIANFGSVKLLYTTPFVLYGIFRYLYLIHCKNKGGDPTTLLVTDIPMLLNVFVWGFVVMFIIYF